MTTRSRIALAAISVSLLTTGSLAAQQAPAKHEHDHADHAEQPPPQVEHDLVSSMTPGHAHHGPHIKLTEPRPVTPEDQARAEAIVGTFREALEKYKDYRAAIAAGYQPFLPKLPLPEHHFTNYWIGFEAAFHFDPARPTSLLYKKVAGGWELLGAMYTAPKNSTEAELNQRAPLSVARWHAHINVCLPQPGQGATADWTNFGPRGSITTPEACAQAGGRFVPQLFGWMLHVYPWEKSPEKIWGH
jgi:hypothetical protein